MKKLNKLWMFLFLLTASASFSSEAQAGRSWIFGLDSADLAVHVPSRMCVYPGQTIRFRPDVLDDFGNRLMLPMNSFIWRFTRSNGVWNQWDSRFSNFFYPFRFSAAFDSVWVEMTLDMGRHARLEMVAPGHTATLMNLVDADRIAQPSDCAWGPNSIYVGGRRPPEPLPPPDDEDDNVLTCGEVCLVGAKCGDSCPSTGRCQTFFDGNGQVRFHKVLACNGGF